MPGRKKDRSNARPAPPIRPEAGGSPSPIGVALKGAICVALVLATFFAYRRSLSSAFITLDDPWYVTANERVQEGLNASTFVWAWTAFDASNWHPVTWISHLLDVTLFGLDAGKHHLTSVLLHGIDAVLLLLLLFRMTGALWRSALVAALFALHPLHVESVAWIAERKDVPSTLFWFLTLLAWVAYTRSKGYGPYLLALLSFALGLMSKPMLVTLPFTLLLLDFWPLGRMRLPLRGEGETGKRLLWEKVPFFAMSAASCVVTVIAQRSGGAVRLLSQVPLRERAATAVTSCLAYLQKTFWPVSLSVFYPYTHTGLLTFATVAGVLLLAGVSVLAFALRLRAPSFSSAGSGISGRSFPSSASSRWGTRRWPIATPASPSSASSSP